MITFQTNIPGNALGRRFIALVNRLLPAPWRFAIEPTPQGYGILSLADGLRVAQRVDGVARLRRLGVPAPGRGDPWRQDFARQLGDLIGLRHRYGIELVDNDPRVFFGSFNFAQLDVADLEGVDERSAAANLIHELDEEANRPAVSTAAHLVLSSRAADRALLRAAFGPAHVAATVAEGAIMGAARLESQQLSQPSHVNLANVSATQDWVLWVPYLEPEPSRRVYALKLRLRGRNILASARTTVPFADLAVFRAAFAHDPAAGLR